MGIDDPFVEGAIVRISKIMFALSAAGFVAAFAWRGWKWGAGFAVGAVASWLNYRWLKQIVDALSGKRPTSKRVAILAGLRYLLLGGGAYVILHYSPISLLAAMIGLFVAAGAVIVEILYELMYART